MARRFVVAVNSTGADAEQIFTTYLQGMGATWWHWIGNFWLVVDYSNTMNAAMLRDQLVRIMPGMWCVALEIGESRDWVGFGPKTDALDMGKWLDDVWDRRDD